jgi:hypothetical protein
MGTCFEMLVLVVMWRKLESGVSCNIRAIFTAPLIGLHNITPSRDCRYRLDATHLHSDSILRHLCEDQNRDNYVKRSMQAAVAATLYIVIRKVVCSNLDRDTCYSD